ncbi:hypothetical protein [Marinagarivorans cellulosilyticus]|nr:hypothetical protein [Marinagarivorans cellulosilyticus]
MVDDPAYQNFLLKLEQDKANVTELNDSAVIVEEVLPNPEDTTVMRFSTSLSDSASLNKSAVFIFSQAQEKLNSEPAGIQDRIDSIDILKKTIQKGL